MRKIYIDLAIVAVCVICMIKFTKLFVLVVAIGAFVWFFLLDDDKKKEIKDKISILYNIK